MLALLENMGKRVLLLRNSGKTDYLSQNNGSSNLLIRFTKILLRSPLLNVV